MLSQGLRHSLCNEELWAFCYDMAESFVAFKIHANRLSQNDMIYREWAGGER